MASPQIELPFTGLDGPRGWRSTAPATAMLSTVSTAGCWNCPRADPQLPVPTAREFGPLRFCRCTSPLTHH